MKVSEELVDAALDEEIRDSRGFPRLVHSRLSRILVIEDSVDLNRALTTRLRMESFKVQSAYDGIEGLEKILNRTPDLIVLDLGLPRLGGYALLHRLRVDMDLNSLPVIVLTANDDPELERKARAWGVRRVLRKPIRQKKILQVIKEVLEEQS